MDEKQGIADDHGIPWQGKLPTDIRYYRRKSRGGTVLMGEVMYNELTRPMPGRRNLVLALAPTLRPGFEKVKDLATLLQNPPENFWVLGGASIFEQTLDAADELYLTQIEGDFGCTKFFPEFKDTFELAEESQPQIESGITFRFQIWKRKT
ncbi:MAG TPA: dihydrofolate reductase [Verrucomicrobiae bacterium]|nr:dihydrofolate reductase [Verrucomicrobiae bacterium]